MSKNNKYKKKDDDELAFDDDFDSGSMAEFENYEKFEIENHTSTINAKAKEIVNAICNAYLSIPESAEDDNEEIKKAKELVENVKFIESSNLAIMMEQVQIAKHLLHTLVRRFDNGGYVNNDLFNMIQEQSKQMMSITMQFSKYARNLPDYFAITKTELKIESSTVTLLQQQYTSSGFLDATITEDEQLYVSTPQRGTMELALSVQESIKKVSEKFIETADVQMDFSPDDLVDEEDFDEDFMNINE